MVSMGWTWDYIDWHVDLIKLAALTKYWVKHPPAHIVLGDICFMLQEFMGFERQQAPKEYEENADEAQQQQDLDKLMDDFIKSGGR
jgi:hypothetical protein